MVKEGRHYGRNVLKICENRQHEIKKTIRICSNRINIKLKIAIIFKVPPSNVLHHKCDEFQSFCLMYYDMEIHDCSADTCYHIRELNEASFILHNPDGDHDGSKKYVT